MVNAARFEKVRARMDSGKPVGFWYKVLHFRSIRRYSEEKKMIDRLIPEYRRNPHYPAVSNNETPFHLQSDKIRARTGEIARKHAYEIDLVEKIEKMLPLEAALSIVEELVASGGKPQRVESIMKAAKFAPAYLPFASLADEASHGIGLEKRFAPVEKPHRTFELSPENKLKIVLAELDECAKIKGGNEKLYLVRMGVVLGIADRHGVSADYLKQEIKVKRCFTINFNPKRFVDEFAKS